MIAIRRAPATSVDVFQRALGARDVAPGAVGAGPIALIAEVSANGVIGANYGLPWRLDEDLRHFRALTLGHGFRSVRFPNTISGRNSGGWLSS